MLNALRERMPRMLIAEYSATEKDKASKVASGIFDESVRVLHHFDKAKRILSLDSDFLHHEAGTLANSRSFAKGRRVANQEDAARMSRVYAVESPYSLVGTMADHRLRLPSSQVPAFAALMAAAILDARGLERPLAQALRDQASGLQVDPRWVQECAADLISAGSESLVVAGYHQSPVVHALVLLINQILGANGTTVRYVRTPARAYSSIEDLAERIRSGAIETLVIVGGNPVYNAPASLNWASLQKSVSQVIRYGYHFDETALEANWQIAASHYLESWSDGRTWDGTLVPVQPMILPLFDTLPELEFLARLGSLGETDSYQIVRTTLSEFGLSADRDFNRFLADGLLPGSAFTAGANNASVARIKSAIDLAAIVVPEVSQRSLEVRLAPDYRIGDGRFNNNGWLQEVPDPLNKLTWDNAILISPALAEALGFDTKSGEFLIGGIARRSANFLRGREQAPLAELTVNGVTITGPVHIQPGLPDWSIGCTLGFGRTRTGRVGTGTGFNVYPLLRDSGAYVLNGAQIRLTGRFVNLANTQVHWSMEGRAIVRETNTEYYKKNQDWVNQMGVESHSPPVLVLIPTCHWLKDHLPIRGVARPFPNQHLEILNPMFKSGRILKTAPGLFHLNNGG
ncbi:MAG: hypothetical protein LR015_03890 [Verrucomicrobia bacterium]|nr:hypothetical protein [Verrucomicrobiota bacterium]